jgi:phosphate-selective porin OprO/OprP
MSVDRSWRLLRRVGYLLLGVLATAAPASAQSGDQAPAAEPSAYDKIWKLATLYDDPSNRVVQRVAFTGRYQHDFSTVSADQGDANEWNARRMRLGPRLTVFRHVTIHTEIELNPQERDPLYVRLTDAYVSWSKAPALVVTAGKHGVPFTLDGATSSKELLAIDRGNLSNNIWFTNEYVPGISLSGRKGAWTYRGGLFSSGRATREFGEFNGAVFTLGVLGYDFATRLGVKEALLTGNYVHQRPDADNTFTRRLEHITSINFRLDNGRWGVRADLSNATGSPGQRDLWGWMAMPYFNVTGTLQVVVRYTVVDSDGLNGVQLGTYENRIGRGLGDEYREGYLGVNYYFYGHKLKLQSGLQFADMHDRAGDGGAYSGRSWTTGLRVGW